MSEHDDENKLFAADDIPDEHNQDVRKQVDEDFFDSLQSGEIGDDTERENFSSGEETYEETRIEDDSKDDSDYGIDSSKFSQLEQISSREKVQVYRIFDKSTSFMNFHKRYNLLKFGKSAVSEFLHEEEILKRIDQTEGCNASPKLITTNSRWLEVRFEGGIATLAEVHKLMSIKEKEWRESDLVFILIAISDILKELKRIGLAHCNIKPQNIVFLPQASDNKFDVRLVNFESAEKFYGRKDDEVKNVRTMLYEQPNETWKQKNMPLEE